MSVVRAKEENPTLQKVRKLEQYLEDLKLSISVGYGDQLIVHDTESGATYQYRDEEQSMSGHDTTSEMPCAFGTKLIRDLDEVM